MKRINKIINEKINYEKFMKLLDKNGLSQSVFSLSQNICSIKIDNMTYIVVFVKKFVL